MPTEHRFNAIVLAADRGPGDPVAMAAGVPAKCLTPIAGSPMVVRVVRALERSGCIETILLCGPTAEPMRGSAELRELLADGRVRWMEPGATPSTSAALALAALPKDEPVLLTTGDHALLDPAMVRHFLEQASASGGDVAVGLAPHELVQGAHPQTRRTVLKFSDGRYCGCNLFAFLSPRGRGMARIWTQVEAQRKKPIRVIGLVGWGAMLLYALGLLSVGSAVRRISKKTGIDARVVTMPFAEAAIDVDSVADLDLVRDIVARSVRGGPGPSPGSRDSS
jgi:CTP:molybdopterin cytidylyltransferase MocA